ncbi:MAG: ABC transporter substrate-binding protein [Myxococcota bacterium]|nr:ABC transporter substrate-binding protein [Myxococcota bacterium]
MHRAAALRRSWSCGVPAALLAAVLAAGSTAAAPRYVEAPALASTIRGGVKSCSAAKPLRVPLISWGGDIATIHANGNAARTKKGSVFAEKGLDLQLVREDVFAKQVEAYLSCQSPFLRGTLGMVNMAAEVTSRDARTEMVPIYQMTWSAGGDALVVKSGIGSPKDLRGKTIVLQAYGPHVDYLTRVLKDAGLTTRDVKIKWVRDLVGLSGDTPAAAFYADASVHAAFVIIPDALALTSAGTVGTGAEDSVRGATILLSTKTANRIIADVYMVRRDFLKANRSSVESFVHGLLIGEERLGALVKARDSRGSDYKAMISAAAEILLDSPQAVADAEGMYADAEFVGYAGNVKFFGDPNYPRGLPKLNREIQQAFVGLALLGKTVPIDHARFDYNRFKPGLTETAGVEAPRFDREAVARVVSRKQQQGTLREGELFSFEVFFQPNQNEFSADLYGESFDRVVELASTYGGAIITVEGHSDPLGYLRSKKEGKPEVVLRRMKQATRNLSLSRANAVRDAIVSYAGRRNVNIDTSQFAVVGHGIGKPKSGICGGDPCAPKTEQEWRDNMRVEFRIIQVEAEASVFKPL